MACGAPSGETAPPHGARSVAPVPSGSADAARLAPRSRRVGSPLASPPSPRRAGPKDGLTAERESACRGVGEPAKRGRREAGPLARRISLPRPFPERAKPEQRGSTAARERAAPGRPSAPGRWAPPRSCGRGAPPPPFAPNETPSRDAPMAEPLDPADAGGPPARSPAFSGARGGWRVGGRRKMDRVRRRYGAFWRRPAARQAATGWRAKGGPWRAAPERRRRNPRRLLTTPPPCRSLDGRRRSRPLRPFCSGVVS